MSRQGLDSAVTAFEATSAMFIHADLEPFKPPEFKLKKCHYANRCLCSGAHDHLLGLIEDRLVFCLKAHCPKPRRKGESLPARLALKAGSIVVRLHSEGVADVHWLHISSCNLTSWEMSMVSLAPSDDVEHIRRTEPPRVPLRALHGCTWKDSWSSLAALDFDRAWKCDLYTLVSSGTFVTDQLEPDLLQVRRFTAESILFWAGLSGWPASDLPHMSNLCF
jgi:hypothetical protein